MDAHRFDALARRFTVRLSRRRGLAFLGFLGPGALAIPDSVAAKKKRCPPCKRRKKGKCRGALPDGAPCPGGTCRGGVCRADPCPGEQPCEGECIPLNQCCTRNDCPALPGYRCCNGECTDQLPETGDPCSSVGATCCSNYCQQVDDPNIARRCAATCRGKPCALDSDCCRGAPCLPTQTGGSTCGGCQETEFPCERDADCCYSACTAPPGTTATLCLSYPGQPCQKNRDCWSCSFDNHCTVPITGGSRAICHDGFCGCPYTCCSNLDCPDDKFCEFDGIGLNGECQDIIIGG